MINRLKTLLPVVCIVMVFTAQTYRQQQDQQNSRPQASRPASTRNVQNKTEARPRGQASVQRAPAVQYHQQAQAPTMRRTEKVMQTPARPQSPSQGWTKPRVYAVPSAPSVKSNRLFGRHHSNNWQPRYNFYDNQYHFYPYVNITSLVELTTNSVMIAYGGQNYCYDLGTFYLLDASGQYEAVPPPLGIMVPALPPNAYQVSVDGQIYWRYKGVFYIQEPQGYQVIGPMEPVSA
jgi:hypothetical protein